MKGEIRLRNSGETVSLRPGETLTVDIGATGVKCLDVSTGLHVEIPSGYDGKITARSGLAKKHGIYILGGEIDSNYRGEIIVIMGQLGSEPITFNAGDRIAQLVVRSLYQGPVVRVKMEQLSNTDRGAGGFGSTGGVA